MQCLAGLVVVMCDVQGGGSGLQAAPGPGPLLALPLALHHRGLGERAAAAQPLMCSSECPLLKNLTRLLSSALMPDVMNMPAACCLGVAAPLASSMA
jgi:hypothetical protein